MAIGAPGVSYVTLSLCYQIGLLSLFGFYIGSLFRRRMAGNGLYFLNLNIPLLLYIQPRPKVPLKSAHKGTDHITYIETSSLDQILAGAPPEVNVGSSVWTSHLDNHSRKAEEKVQRHRKASWQTDNAYRTQGSDR